MITDKYQEETQSVNKHVSLLIVDSTATVTAVPGDEPTVEDAEIMITNDIIDGESFDLYESLCSSANLVFGACESSHIQLVIHSSDIPVTADRLLTVYRYLNHDSDTLMTIGTYRVTSDKYNADRTKRTIVMYDELKDILNLDMTEWYYGFFTDGEDTHTVKDMRDSFWTYLNANGFEVTQEDVDLPNDDMTVVLTIEDDIDGGTIIKDICQINGCFGHIDRSNTFRYIFLKKYTKSADFEITDAERIGVTTYQDYRVMSIVKVVLYDENNNVIVKKTDSGKTTYRIHGNSLLFGKRAGNEMNSVIENVYGKIRYKRYTPCDVKTLGNLAVEVGDYMEVTGRVNFKSYVLTRHLSGIQTRFDEYTSKGDYRQPAVIVKSKTASSAASRTGSSYSSGELTDGKIVELIRNIGFRLLDEPTNVSVEYDTSANTVSLKWTDPDDITDSKPVEAAWAGTVVVRTENYPPTHRWEENAEIIYDEQTRNEHSTLALVDDTVEVNKKYYYGIFPYDYDGITKHYRWTKVITIDTTKEIDAPEIHSATASGLSVTVNYYLPTGSYASRKLVYKANDIPESVTDGQSYNIGAGAGGEGHSTITGLQSNTLYYFMIYDEDSNHRLATSNVVQCTTGIETDWNFGYTGAVQTFTAPASGRYQLEVWGAQGVPNTYPASYETRNVGGYSVGEINLTAGDKLYIGVGGKGNNYTGGWNGGGNAYDDMYIYGNAGGGCTHIAKRTGQLYQLENYKEDVIIVAGGGGGCGDNNYGAGVYYSGGDGGGYIGGYPNFFGSAGTSGSADTEYGGGQTAERPAGVVHLFGRAKVAAVPSGYSSFDAYAGGGGGWYGGYSEAHIGSSFMGRYAHAIFATGGSGYIAHPDLYNKCMYMKTDAFLSSAVNTKTVQALGASATAQSKYCKTGDGYAKIHYLGT